MRTGAERAGVLCTSVAVDSRPVSTDGPVVVDAETEHRRALCSKGGGGQQQRGDCELQKS